jgi:hypothetical protein
VTPRSHKTNQKVPCGFQGGNTGKAVVPEGKFAGKQIGMIVVGSRPNFPLIG